MSHHKAVIPEHPITALRTRNVVKNLPFIAGVVGGEGTGLFSKYQDQFERLSFYFKNASSALLLRSEPSHKPVPEMTLEVIKRFYVGRENISEFNQAELLQMFSDARVVSPTQFFLDLWSRAIQDANLYSYFFNVNNGRRFF